MRIRLHLLFLVFTLLCTKAWAAELRYWDWGQTPKRENYGYQLLELALEETRDSHGEYSLTRVKTSFSTSRVRREINENGVVNIRVGPYLPAHKFGSAEEINRPVRVGTLFGLLGYRSLLAHAESVEGFKNIQTVEELSTNIAGLGKGWADVDILRANHLPVNDSANVEYLLPMLERRRFDYFPVGVLEMDSVLANWTKPETFQFVPDLILFYELPVLFYVGKQEEALAQRIETGLKIALKNGGMQILFQEYFAEDIAQISGPKVRVLQTRNPFLEDEEAKQIMRLKLEDL
jgi:hypothetical protein